MPGIAADVASAVWGYLVGFVGWGSLFRLGEPLARWLVANARAYTSGVVIARLLVTFFLLMAILLALGAVPMLLSAAGSITLAPGDWRHLYGISFIASLAGLVTLGVIHRLRS